MTPYGGVAGIDRAGEPSTELIEVLLDAGADVNAPTAHAAVHRRYEVCAAVR